MRPWQRSNKPFSVLSCDSNAGPSLKSGAISSHDDYAIRSLHAQIRWTRSRSAEIPDRIDNISEPHSTAAITTATDTITKDAISSITSTCILHAPSLSVKFAIRLLRCTCRDPVRPGFPRLRGSWESSAVLPGNLPHIFRLSQSNKSHHFRNSIWISRSILNISAIVFKDNYNILSS